VWNADKSTRIDASEVWAQAGEAAQRLFWRLDDMPCFSTDPRGYPQWFPQRPDATHLGEPQICAVGGNGLFLWINRREMGNSCGFREEALVGPEPTLLEVAAPPIVAIAGRSRFCTTMPTGLRRYKILVTVDNRTS
jgi:hypothetical protein